MATLKLNGTQKQVLEAYSNAYHSSPEVFLKQKDIADQLEVHFSTVSKNVIGLASMGLLEAVGLDAYGNNTYRLTQLGLSTLENTEKYVTRCCQHCDVVYYGEVKSKFCSTRCREVHSALRTLDKHEALKAPSCLPLPAKRTEAEMGVLKAAQELTINDLVAMPRSFMEAILAYVAEL